MNEIPVCWVAGGPGAWWDQGFLESLLDGNLWTLPLQPDHRLGLDALGDVEGAVFVVPGQHSLDQVEALQKRLDGLSWALIVVGGDEEALYPVEGLSHPNMRLWIQTPRPGRHEFAHRKLGVGWTPQTPRLLARLHAAADKRPLDFFFSGQTPEDHPPRLRCVEILRNLTSQYRGELHPTSRFAEQYEEGTTLDERSIAYLRRLASAKIAPAPCGPVTPDTFRCWEALEAGSIPIVNATAPYAKDVEGYWPFLFDGELPFPIIADWTEFPAVLSRLLADWPASANRVWAWWQQRKREQAYWLLDDLTALTGTAPDVSGITVLVPTSPIPSHPDTAIIEETIGSIRAQLPLAEILLLIDGVRSEQDHMRADYEEYVRRLLWLTEHAWPNVAPIRFETHEHQSGMTRHVLDEIRTSCLLFVEHDTPLKGRIDWEGIVRAIEGEEANLIRLHHSTDIYAEHKHLMLDNMPKLVAGVPLLRTVQWSQRPHVASTELYRKMFAEHFRPDERWMIEDRMHSVLSNAWHEDGVTGWNRWKVWIYAPSGSLERSYHLDGRQGAPKWVDS